MNKTIQLSWRELTSAWNDASDKRYQECLANSTPPCIINDDDHELTRYEYFEKENNLTMTMTKNDLGFNSYELTFNTEQDLIFFTLKWL